MGAVGVGTDGGVRDLNGVKPLGFHVFAAGCVVAHGTFSFKEIGIPVEVSGVVIQPGDLIHGDPSGVTTISLGIGDQAYTEYLKVREREIALKDSVQSKECTLEVLRKRMLGK